MDHLETLKEKLAAWSESAVAALPNLAIAIIVFTVAWAVSRAASRAICKPVSRVSHNQAATDLITSMVRVAVIAAGFFISLRILQLEGAVASLLAGVGIMGLALGFAFQDIMANFVSGVILAIRRPFQVGDMIKTGDFFGTVEAVDLRATKGRNFEGQIVTLPNKDVLQNPIHNYTTSKERRVDVPVGVAYDADLEEVTEVATQAVADLNLLPNRSPELYFEGFGGSSIDCRVRVWIDPTQHSFIEIRHKAIIAIQRAFADRGISIPFPIRTLDFGAGAVGGEELHEKLSIVRDRKGEAANDRGAEPAAKAAS